MCSGYSKSFNLGKQVSGMAALLPARDGSAATDALVFLMQVDNRGPPTADDVVAGWASTQQAFRKWARFSREGAAHG
jgi:hypothetical protein